MERITLAPTPGAPGVAKAVKKPASHADALAAAAAKEILGPGLKPTHLFFGDGGEIEVDAWELVADKDTVYCSADEEMGVRPTTEVPVAQPTWASLAPPTSAVLSRQVSSFFADSWAASLKPLNVAIGLHAFAFIEGHVPFLVDTLLQANDSSGASAFVMFVFIPASAIWVVGLFGAIILHPSVKLCLDWRGKPNTCCSKALSTIALVLHAIIAYIETFLLSNFASWIIVVLIIKNVCCIVGEVLALIVACRLSAKDWAALQRQHAANVAKPTAVAVTHGVATESTPLATGV